MSAITNQLKIEENKYANELYVRDTTSNNEYCVAGKGTQHTRIFSNNRQGQEIAVVKTTRNGETLSIWEKIYYLITHTKIVLSQTDSNGKVTKTWVYVNDNSVKKRLGAEALTELKRVSRLQEVANEILESAFGISHQRLLKQHLGLRY